MTAARAQIESVVDALRRKQLLAITLTAFVEMAFVGACLYAALRLGLPNLHLSKAWRVLVLVCLMLVWCAALFFEQARQGRTGLYLAKRIDDANQLGDHLVSALAFSDPTTVAFEQACVDSLVLRLQATQIRIPDVRLERVWLLAPAFLIAVATGTVEWKRQQKPEDDGAVRIALPAGLRAKLDALGKSGADDGKVDPALAKRVAEARDALDKLVEHSSSKENVLRDISTARDSLREYDAQHPSLVDAALQLGDPASQRAQQLLNALRSGQADSVSDALRTLSEALSGKTPPPLNEQERAEIASILESLAQAARTTDLAPALTEAAKDVRAMPPEAKNDPKLAEEMKQLAGPLNEALTRDRAKQRLESQIRSVLAEATRQADLQAMRAQGEQASGGSATTRTDAGGAGLGLPAPDRASAGDEDDRGALDAPGGSPMAGSGAGAAREDDFHGGSPETPANGRDSRVTSPWVGAPVRQLVSAGASNDTAMQDATRAILQTQTRQLESEVRREEIPAEYAQSIRRYFSNIQLALEQSWKPNK